MDITKKNKRELFKKTLPTECCKVLVTICGDAKKRVLAKQAEYYELTGTHLSKDRAINKILEGK